MGQLRCVYLVSIALLLVLVIVEKSRYAKAKTKLRREKRRNVIRFERKKPPYSYERRSKKEAQRFILFSRQRSGSHYVVSLLKTKEIVLGAEMMSHGERLNASNWKRDFFRQFDSLETSHQSKAVGFLLHHNQLWCYHAYATCIFSLAEFLRSEKILVLCLVRESALMTITSDYFASLGPHLSLTTNDTHANETKHFALRHQMELTSSRLEQIHNLEYENFISHGILSLILGPSYHYVSYESLLSPTHHNATLKGIIRFLQVPSQQFFIEQFQSLQLALQKHKTLLILHTTTCESRILNWTHAKHLLQPSTLSACEALSSL